MSLCQQRHQAAAHGPGGSTHSLEHNVTNQATQFLEIASAKKPMRLRAGTGDRGAGRASRARSPAASTRGDGTLSDGCM